MIQQEKLAGLQRQMEEMSTLFRLVADEIEIRPGHPDQNFEEEKSREYGEARNANIRQHQEDENAAQAVENDTVIF